MMDRPTDHELAEQIDNHAQEELAFICLQLGDIRDPFTFRFQGHEVPLQMIADARWRQAWLAALAPIFLARPTLQAIDGHQTGDPVLAGRLAFLGQVLVHARRTDDALAVLSSESADWHQYPTREPPAHS